jgi:cytochrome P450
VAVMLDEKYIHDRHTMHRWLRSQAPICEAVLPDGRRVWLISRYADAFEALDPSPIDPVPGDVDGVLAGLDGDFDLVQDFAKPVAGDNAVAHLIVNGVVDLLHNPDQAGVNVAELSRHDGPYGMALRTVTEPITLAGIDIEAGETVAVLIGSANRDPVMFDRPDELDFGRNTTGHLTLGDHEELVATAITKLRQRFPDLALNGEPVRLDDVITNGYATAPVTAAGPRSADPA